MTLFLLLACRSPADPAFAWSQPACDHDADSWYDSPTMSFLLAANDGLFSYDPPGAVLEGRTGHVDLTQGVFSWDNRYAEGTPTTRLHAEGTGAVSPDGDLSLTWIASAMDVLDETTALEVAMSRTGCREQWTVLESGPELTTERDTTLTIVSADRIEGSSTLVVGQTIYDLTFVDSRDLSSTYTLDYTVGDWHYSGEGTDLGDGTGSRSWVGWDEQYDYAGQFAFAFDGSFQHTYEVHEGKLPKARIDYEESYGGEGTGTWSFYDVDTGDWMVCDYTYDDDSCAIVCPDNPHQPLPCEPG